MAMQYAIKDGPSKLELMLGLFDWGLERERSLWMVIQAQFKSEERVGIFIQSVERDDKSWIVEGWFDGRSGRFRALYDTKMRKGAMDITD